MSTYTSTILPVYVMKKISKKNHFISRFLQNMKRIAQYRKATHFTAEAQYRLYTRDEQPEKYADHSDAREKAENMHTLCQSGQFNQFI